MQATLLIVDSIANNRVALKVKLAAAWYDTADVATGQEALIEIARSRPNLILVNANLTDMTLKAFCAEVTALFGKDAPPILGLTQSVQDREPLLRSGIEDVLAVPVDDALLIARIRAVLRAHASESEWHLRDGTFRALGFAEPRQTFEHPVSAMFLHADHRDSVPFLNSLASNSGMQARGLYVGQAMRDLSSTIGESVVALVLPENEPEHVVTVLADLRANPETRHNAILVCAPKGRSDLAVQALDMGADDATIGPIPEPELSLRLRRLNTRAQINRSLRATVKNGVEAAIRDPLTGLYNRRYALPHLDRIAEKSRASGTPFAVMIADLDHFKRINDWHGHDAGDAVLTTCAKRLLKNMRAVDLVARIGGEEFLIVMPNTTREEAQMAAFRLCQKISDTPIAVPGTQQHVDVTISIGLAINEDGTHLAAHSLTENGIPKELISRADKALYEAKKTGRNRVIVRKPAAA